MRPGQGWAPTIPPQPQPEFNFALLHCCLLVRTYAKTWGTGVTCDCDVCGRPNLSVTHHCAECSFDACFGAVGSVEIGGDHVTSGET